MFSRKSLPLAFSLEVCYLFLFFMGVTFILIKCNLFFLCLFICFLFVVVDIFWMKCRYKEGHAIRHWKDTQHCYSLDLEAQRVWDYVGDIYVHRLNHSKGDCKLVTNMSSRCISTDGDCGYTEDSGISGALYNSKVEAVLFLFLYCWGTSILTLSLTSC